MRILVTQRDTKLLSTQAQTAVHVSAPSDHAEPLAAEVTLKCQALEEELSRVKQKYRAAQYDVERERRAHAATKAQLVSLQNRLSRYEGSTLWRCYLALVHFWMRLGSFARKLSGGISKHRRHALEAIAGSGLFDAEWYLKENPDVGAAGLDPLLHFYENGWREGRDPGPLFATSAYLKNNTDVARSGINPLLHYIEYGQSEGRPVRAPAASRALAQSHHNFPPAAPVFRAELPLERTTRWQRSYRLSADEPNAFVASGHMVGFVRDAAVRQSIKSAFGQLASLSGLAPTGWTGGDAVDAASSAELVDAWYVNKIQLRTRWRGRTSPVVIRAFQYDPADANLALVGEGIAETEMDPLDLSLVDPWFPILVVFGRPDGSLTGARLLAFPSLCRGGLHYPELLALSPDDPDPVRVGLGQAARLQKALRDPARLIRSISVDVEGADGTSPMFDAHFRRWLEKVAGVEIGPADGATGPAADLLRGESGEQCTGCGTLLLPPDMVPSLSVLALTQGAGDRTDSPKFLPMIIAGSEPSQPGVFVDLPQTAARALATSASGYAAPWPCFMPAEPVRLASASGPAAIRLPSGRAMADAELLTPAMGSALVFPEKASSAITWLLFPHEWRTEELAESIQALSRQDGAENHKVAFVGGIDDDLHALAKDLFGDSAILFPDAENPGAELSTPFVAYLGAGVILHDNRAAAFLTHLLQDPAIASASCALLTAERRGKSWHVSVADAGLISGSAGWVVPETRDVAQLLWRSAFPVVRPPRDLWVARLSSVKKWLGSRPPQRLATGVHFCTTLVTASYVGARGEEGPEVRVPPAPDESAIKARALFG